MATSILRHWLMFLWIFECSAIHSESWSFGDPSTIPDLRNDFCKKVTALHNGSLVFKDALKGMHLSIITSNVGQPWFEEPLGNADPDQMSGFQKKLADALSRVGGFTYTMYSVPPSDFQFEWADYLKASLGKMDVNADYWTDTLTRSRDGMRPPYNFLDMSYIPVTSGNITELGFWEKVTSFSDPLDEWLWALFIVVSVATSIVFCMVERSSSTDSWEHTDTDGWKLQESVFNGFLSLTGGGGFAPHTTAGKLITLTFTFFVLLLVSAYTANLAAVLVHQKELEAACDTWGACAAGGNKVCAMEGWPATLWLKQTHRSIFDHQLLISTADEEMYQNLHAGRCQAILTTATDYQNARRHRERNRNCLLNRVGQDPLMDLGGGWMTRSDYAEKCTSVLRDALSAIFFEVANSGELQRLLDELFPSLSSVPGCDADGKPTGLQKVDGSFSMESMIGPLLIHLIGVSAALVVFVTTRRLHGHQHDSSCKEEDALPETLDFAPEAPEDNCRRFEWSSQTPVDGPKEQAPRQTGLEWLSRASVEGLREQAPHQTPASPAWLADVKDKLKAVGRVELQLQAMTSAIAALSGQKYGSAGATREPEAEGSLSRESTVVAP